MRKYNFSYWAGLQKGKQYSHMCVCVYDYLFSIAVLGSKQNKIRIPTCSLLPIYTVSTTINILHKSGTFASINEPTLIHYCTLMSMANIRACSWCCSSYGFWQLYNGMHPPLHYTESHGCSRKSCVLLNLITLFSNPEITNIFHYVQSCAFTRMTYSWNQTVCSFFKLASFIS